MSEATSASGGSAGGAVVGRPVDGGVGGSGSQGSGTQGGPAAEGATGGTAGGPAGWLARLRAALSGVVSWFSELHMLEKYEPLGTFHLLEGMPHHDDCPGVERRVVDPDIQRAELQAACDMCPLLANSPSVCIQSHRSGAYVSALEAMAVRQAHGSDGSGLPTLEAADCWALESNASKPSPVAALASFSGTGMALDGSKAAALGLWWAVAVDALGCLFSSLSATLDACLHGHPVGSHGVG